MGFNPFFEKFDFSGENLIEASAGTGKTYSITAIYLRLILEQNLEPHDILTVTFTVDATEELKRRIRKILKESLEFFEEKNGFAVEDRGLEDYLKSLDKNYMDTFKASLKKALIELDDAPIYTIHKFCKRLLSENPIETDVSLNIDFSSDEEEFIDEIVFYVYRKWLYKENSPVASIFWEEFVKDNKTRKIVEKYLSSVNPQPQPYPENIEFDDVNKAYQEFVNMYKQAKNEYVSNKNKSAKYISEYFSYDIESGVFELFSATKKALKNEGFKSKYPEIAKAYDEFLKKADAYLINRIIKTLNSANRYIEDIKIQKNRLTFSDLIRWVFKSVSKGSLKNRNFRALLIDEFQDTDFLQVYIFKSLFKGRTSFYIGDPKQSIYGFRSADLNAYFHATENIKKRFSLDVCYRSTANLVDAFNRIFSKKNFFMDDRIKYSDVKASDAPRLRVITNDNSKDFNFYILKGVTTKDRVLPIIEEQIRYLLNSAYVEEKGSRRSVEPQDICILVRNNSDAEKIRDYLSKNGIKCSLTTTKSVFETNQAKNLLRILKAINGFSNTSYVKTALITDIFHKTFEEISQDETLSSYKETFALYRERLNKKGIMAAFIHIFNMENSKEFILKQPGGERIYVNYLHILEILQGASRYENLSIEKLIRYLSLRINDPSLAQEEGELRLESDENALKVSTIHKSKGLEFPIVFVVYFSSKSETAKNGIPYVFEFDEKSNAHILKQNNGKSKPDEYARLLYVALTRAMARCYLFDYERKNSSVVDTLLYGVAKDKEKEKDNKTKYVDKVIESLKDSFDSVATIAIPSGNSQQKQEKPVSKISAKLHFKEFKGKKKHSYVLSSYSSISRGMEVSYEEELIEDYAYDMPFKGKIDLPVGAAVGSIIHKILEKIDFDIEDEDLKSKIEKTMSGYSDRALNYAFDMIKNVLNSPIVIENKMFRLRDLDRSRRMSEMKFFIPLKNLNAFTNGLKNIFKNRKELDFCERLNKMKPDTIKRYLIGFIDLVFEFDNKIYVIDWKTNYLGESLEDYSFENLHREVVSNDYFLQFSIYQLAVYKYIKSLGNDLGIGESFYIFMRGFKPENNKGLYRYSFSEDELDELARGI